MYCKTGTNLRRSIVHCKIIVLIKLRIIIPPILDHGCATTLQKSSKRSRVSAVFRDSQQSYDFAMSSLILPRLSRKTCRLTDYKLQIPIRETHSRICLHLIMSTDWWMFSLVKMAAHRPRSPRNAAVVMKTTKTVYRIENQRIMPEKEPGSTLKCLFKRDVRLF